MNLKKTLSIFFILFIFGFLVWSISNNWQTISNFKWRFNTLNFLLLILSVLPIFFINSLSWHFLTKSLGSKVGFKDNFKLWMLSNASRFLPGGVWQYPGRVYLLHKKGETNTLATTAVLLEVLMNLSIGSLIVFLGTFFVKFPFDLPAFRTLLVLIFILPLLVLRFSRTIYLKKIFDRLSHLVKRKIELDKIKFSFTDIFAISILFFMQYFFSGISLFLVSSLALDIPTGLLPNFIVIFTASWLLGYLVIFAPGGLGVQEISIATLLSFYMPFSIASIVAILFRVVLYLAEFITLVIALNMRKDFRDVKKVK